MSMKDTTFSRLLNTLEFIGNGQGAYDLGFNATVLTASFLNPGGFRNGLLHPDP